jgi:hypothetical protein
MADIELFFDPICPWAWVTSRWVQEVADRRGFAVDWRFIALRFVNEERDYAQFPPMYGELHAAGLAMLRLAAAAREVGGGEAVGRFYTELGGRVHRERRYGEARDQDRALFEESLVAAGLPADLADAAGDDRRDDVIRAETRVALARAGDDIGTPVVTFDPGRPSEGSFFGPVVDHIPRGDAALALYDAVVALARTPGFLELKRARPGPGPSAVD